MDVAGANLAGTCLALLLAMGVVLWQCREAILLLNCAGTLAQENPGNLLSRTVRLGRYTCPPATRTARSKRKGCMTMILV